LEYKHMPWKNHSRGDTELTVLALSSDVKATLIQRKALTRQSVTSQIVEALRDRWSRAAAGPVAGYRQPPPGVPMPVGGYQPPAAVQGPAVRAVGDLVVSGRYAGMRVQRTRTGPPDGFDPNAAPLS
jgi:hypothetical protein